MTETPSNEPVVVVHRAGTATEAVVLRSLLESAGIASPYPSVADMFPMREPPKGFNDTDIIVLESQAEEALRLIAEHVSRSGAADTESLDADSTEAADPSA